MTVRRVSRPLALTVCLAGALAGVLTLAACTSPAPEGGTEIPSSAPSSPVAEPAPSASNPTLPDPTCENILSGAGFTELEAAGWEYASGPFPLGEAELDGGVSCTWTNPAEPGGNILTFGWAPITVDEATTAQQQLEAEGWIVETEGDEVYVTEDPAFALTVDEDGYGVTYLFGEGFVQLADVKQGLLVIQRR